MFKQGREIYSPFRLLLEGGGEGEGGRGGGVVNEVGKWQKVVEQIALPWNSGFVQFSQ